MQNEKRGPTNYAFDVCRKNEIEVGRLLAVDTNQLSKYIK